MKKIDFHIHTIATEQDPDEFEFSIESLKEYIAIEDLSAIAITNHNIFKRDNYEYIKKEIEIIVFPGIEVDVEGAHVLVISPQECVDIFEKECKCVEHNYKMNKRGLTFTEFTDCFNHIHDYLIIPHYMKKPKISSELLGKFSDYIICGEVSSAKKWFSCIKSSESLTPVIFSDLRVKENIKKYPSTLTYIACEDITIPKIKVTLKDKSKVHINKNATDNEFQISPDGTNASTGLNVIMGMRSSGKTYTLESIRASFDKAYVKYIEQFEIVNNAKESNFNSFIKKDKNEIVENNICDLRGITNIVSNVDLIKDESTISDFLDSLKDYAEKSENKDEYAKTPLFSTECFETGKDTNLNKLIESIRTLIDNEDYKDLIDKKLGIHNLKDILFSFLVLYCNEQNEVLAINETNELIKTIKSELDERSSMSAISEIDFSSIAANILHEKYFNDFVNKFKEEKVVDSENSLRFSINVIRKKYENASKVKSVLSNKPSISEAFREYDKPFRYIKELQKAGVSSNELYKTLVDVEFNVVNIDDNNSISGGEKAEYVLYSALKDASKYEVVLIDEPESSFDNIFLKKEILEKIKNLSKKTTVFIVTHNSTLGVLMNPDKIIYTAKVGPNQYKLYTGSLTSKAFIDSDNNPMKDSKGKVISSYTSLVDIMEAGEDAYKARRSIYESIANK